LTPDLLTNTASLKNRKHRASRSDQRNESRKGNNITDRIYSKQYQNDDGLTVNHLQTIYDDKASKIENLERDIAETRAKWERDAASDDGDDNLHADHLDNELTLMDQQLRRHRVQLAKARQALDDAIEAEKLAEGNAAAKKAMQLQKEFNEHQAALTAEIIALTAKIRALKGPQESGFSGAYYKARQCGIWDFKPPFVEIDKTVHEIRTAISSMSYQADEYHRIVWQYGRE
jgi:hypothetical protein